MNLEFLKGLNGLQVLMYKDIERESIMVSGAAYEMASVEKVQVYKFKKTEFSFEQDKKTFRVVFSGAVMLNKVIKEHLSNRGSKDPDLFLYDAEKLKDRNEMWIYEIDPTTGVQVEGLSKDARYLYSSLLHGPTYKDELSGREIEDRVIQFAEAVSKCLTEEAAGKILASVPHKKNGTLYKGRITPVYKESIADVEGKVCMLYARNLSDTEMELHAKRIYFGEKLYEEKEAAREAGLLKTREQEKQEKEAERQQWMASDPYAFSEKGNKPADRCDRSLNSRFKKEYLKKNPRIVFPDKVFVFSNMFMAEKAMEEPIIKSLTARGGIWKNHLSGKANYLVAESIESCGEAKLRDAAELIDKGKDLQFVTADELIEAMKKSGK